MFSVEPRRLLITNERQKIMWGVLTRKAILPIGIILGVTLMLMAPLIAVLPLVFEAINSLVVDPYPLATDLGLAAGLVLSPRREFDEPDTVDNVSSTRHNRGGLVDQLERQEEVAL